MEVLKPQKINLNSIKHFSDIFEAVVDEEIEKSYIENYKNNSFELYDLSIKNVIFCNVEIIKGSFEKSSFVDVKFDSCNFSNTSFENCSFTRCEFNNCKLTGCDLSETRMYNVSIIDTNLNYANLSMASMEKVLFKSSGLRNSIFQENKLDKIELIKCDFTQAQFFSTKLINIDLSDCLIEGIAVSIDDIKGAIINQFQAMDLMYLLGVKIK